MIELKDDYGINKQSIPNHLIKHFVVSIIRNLRATYLQADALLLRPEKEQIYQNLSLNSMLMTAR